MKSIPLQDPHLQEVFGAISASSAHIAALEAAIKDVNAAITGGQNAASVRSLVPSVLNPSPAIFSKSLPTGASLLVSARSLEIPEFDPVSADWTQAMHASERRGPFLSAIGEKIWLDTFLLPRLLTLQVSGPVGQTRILARFTGVIQLGLSQTLKISRGSLWIETRWLVPGRTANEFAGIRVIGGSVHLAGTVNISGDSIQLSGAWQVQFVFEPDIPPVALAPPEPGEDALSAKVALPKNATITLDRTGKAVIDFDPLSVDVYGTSVTFNRSAATSFVDTQTRSLVMPSDASLADFAFSSVASDLWKISSSSPIAGSGWSWPIATIDPLGLGEASGAGHVWIRLSAGFQLNWKGLAKQIPPIRSGVFIFAPSQIAAYITLGASDADQELRFWRQFDGDPVRMSTAEIVSKKGSVAQYLSRPGLEAVIFSGELFAHLDRPLAADGGRLRIRMPAGWFVITETSTNTTAGILAYAAKALEDPHISYCLENGFVKARPPVWFITSGTWDGEESLSNGTLTLRFPYRFILPILPDPYAANFEIRSPTDVDAGWAAWTVQWNDPATAALDFAVLSPAPSGLETQLNEDSLTMLGRDPWPSSRVLLDLSSNSDQFGVMIPNQRAMAPVASGLAIVAPANDIAVMTLPPLTWEPMLTKAPKPNEIASGEIPLPPPPNDGGAAIFSADSVELAPIKPLPLLNSYLAAIRKKHHFLARLPLPFGLISILDTRRDSEDRNISSFRGTVGMNRPEFPTGLTGGTQIAFSGKRAPAGGTDPVMPGYVSWASDPDYTRGVLSNNINTRFFGDFGSAGIQHGVPLRHYELSGYGASLFSDWKDGAALGPAIIEARFDAIVGRTSHEVIQMQSGLYPYSARMVRTITMERMPGGWVLREDSGWVATTDGEFAFPGLPGAFDAAFLPIQVHTGTLTAVRKIRNVQLDGVQFTTTPLPGQSKGITWQRVEFDADLDFADGNDPRLNVASGGSAQAVPSRSIVGWIQIDGPTYADPNDGKLHVRPPLGAEIADLLLTYGPAKGPVDCQLLLGGTPTEPGLNFHATGFDVSTATGAGLFHLVVAVRGTPALPRDGTWSVARMASTEPAPSALDPSIPVPIVRATKPVAGWERWHLADPSDILSLADADAPATRYGLLQSFGTQKIFFSRPRVGNDAKPITLPAPPQLADVGSLLHAAGVFPGLADAFDFKLLKDLAVNGGALKFHETFAITDASGNTRSALLADLGGLDAIQLIINYQDEQGNPTMATIKVDPDASPRWSVDLSRMAFTVNFRKDRLIQLFARVRASENSAPTLDGINVQYESFLGCLQTIFTNIQQVAKFLPGGADAGLSVSFSSGHLTIRNSFALPNLPLGAGQITDVAVNMGFEVTLAPFDVSFSAGLGNSEKPFHWIVSPLAGTGAIVVRINSHGLDLLIQAGLGVGLAIDLGIASGSASVALALEIDTGPSPFELKGIFSGRASVDVLQGLASATITLAAGLGIIPDDRLLHKPFLPPSVPPPTPIPSVTIGLVASVSVGIHLSVCWVVDVDFDGYWQFRQDITTPSIPIPLV